jgi:DNA-binding LacI/PurR family transcriptional regulator
MAGKRLEIYGVFTDAQLQDPRFCLVGISEEQTMTDAVEMLIKQRAINPPKWREPLPEDHQLALALEGVDEFDKYLREHFKD